MIVPRKALTEVRRVAELFGKKVNITFDDRVMQFSGDAIIFKTRLIEGKFPNCDPIIPKDKRLKYSGQGAFYKFTQNCSSISTEKLRP
ncbi:MAG: hypothetical protein Ct9H300mP28_17100 [Pseudomonadota bacterium]|nr:MAG: hypothetical protein Ct9H300mP28_17100 [Pseudomonadota bacterium]